MAYGLLFADISLYKAAQIEQIPHLLIPFLFCYICFTSIPGFGFTTHYDFLYQISTPSINRDSKSQLPSPGWQSLRKRNPGAADAQSVPGIVDASVFRHRRLGRQIVLGARSLPPNTTLFVLLPWLYVVASSGYDPSFFQELSSTRSADCIHSIFTYSVQRESRIGVQIKTGGVDHTFLDPTTPDRTDQSESSPGFLTPFRPTFYPFILLIRPITLRQLHIDSNRQNIREYSHRTRYGDSRDRSGSSSIRTISIRPTSYRIKGQSTSDLLQGNGICQLSSLYVVSPATRRHTNRNDRNASQSFNDTTQNIQHISLGEEHRIIADENLQQKKIH